MSKTKILNLIEKLDTSSDKAAEKIIRALAKFGPSITPDLIKAANNKDFPRIRKWSLQALGEVGDKRAAPLLVKALKDERMTVRLHALRGLARMKFKKSSRAVAALLKDESGGVRVNALYTLMVLADKSVGTKIQSALNDPQWYVRQIAAEACGKLGVLKAKRKLSQLAKSDERKAVRTAALKALSTLEKPG